MTKIRFGLFGAGGMGREVMPYVGTSVSEALGIGRDDVQAYFVETWDPSQSQVNGHPLISLEAFLLLDGLRYFNIAVGDGRAREAIADKVGAAATLLGIYAPQSLLLGMNEIGGGAILTVQAYYGTAPIIYTNVDFYEKYLKDDFDGYLLWAAHYLQPSQPRIYRSWSFWQHNEKGRVNGCYTIVDFDVFNGDSLEFQKLLLNR